MDINRDPDIIGELFSDHFLLIDSYGFRITCHAYRTEDSYPKCWVGDEECIYALWFPKIESLTLEIEINNKIMVPVEINESPSGFVLTLLPAMTFIEDIA